MEIILNSCIELRNQNLIFNLFIFSLLARLPQHSTHYLLHLLFDSWHILFSEKIRNLTDSKDSIYIFNEGFLGYLVVREHEDC